MPMRMEPVTKFKVSQGPSTETDAPAKKVPVHFKMAKVRNAGQPDPLSQALTVPPRTTPKDTGHFLKRPVEPKGHQYLPRWEPIQGRAPISGTKATGIRPHTSRPGGNALGRMMNRVGSKSGYPSFKPHGGGGKP